MVSLLLKKINFYSESRMSFTFFLPDEIIKSKNKNKVTKSSQPSNDFHCHISNFLVFFIKAKVERFGGRNTDS